LKIYTSMNKNYINGRAFEYKVKNFFQGLGAEVVRSAGSHGIDLMVIFYKEQGNLIWAVSCKKAKYHTLDERAKLVNLKENSKVDDVLICYPINGLIAMESV